MPERPLHTLSSDVAGLDDRQLAAGRTVDRRTQARERRRRQGERPDSGGDQCRHARLDGVRVVERPLLQVDRRGAALAAQRLPERARAHAAVDHDGGDSTAAAGCSRLQDRGFQADQHDRAHGLRRERVDHRLR